MNGVSGAVRRLAGPSRAADRRHGGCIRSTQRGNALVITRISAAC